MFLFYLFVVTGSVCIIFGIIFIVNPSLLIRLNTMGNKVILFRKESLVYPRILGALIVLLSVYLVYLYINN